MFTAGSPIGHQICSVIRILDDDRVEDSEEQFNVELRFENMSSTIENTGVVIIQDDDGN